MASTLTQERRVSITDDRRGRIGRGGRRAEDHGVAELSAVIPCTACTVAWASLISFEYQRKQSLATYLCPRCGHLEKRLATP